MQNQEPLDATSFEVIIGEADTKDKERTTAVFRDIILAFLTTNSFIEKEKLILLLITYGVKPGWSTVLFDLLTDDDIEVRKIAALALINLLKLRDGTFSEINQAHQASFEIFQAGQVAAPDERAIVYLMSIVFLGKSYLSPGF